MSLEEIAVYEKAEGSEINKAKEVLAYELTKLIHGQEEADKALAAARALFEKGASSADMPTTEVTDADFVDGKIRVTDILVKAGLAPSKGEAKRLITQGGIAINDEKVASFDAALDASAFDGEIIVKKGKKIYHKIVKA